MKIIETSLPGVLIVEPAVFRDPRGYFMETWRQSRYAEADIAAVFVQDNVSYSMKNALRGLHFQNPHPQAKLIQALDGEIFDVAVDIRQGSPTFGKWAGVRLSSGHPRQLYIPEGFAHGFVVLSDTALVAYKCSDYYDPRSETAIAWNDPDIGIEWPVSNPVLSAKDAAAPRLGATAAPLPHYRA